ncbi:hypothetical protein KY363_00205 [Candidatus Woesearchaeota archaeon]|nr:hypothetical protein [Candidatus Woesearchaeota archaeon]
MKCIRVSVKKLEMDSFSIKEGAQLKVYFDDGAKKCLMYSSKLEKVEEDVKNIILKIHMYEKSQNKVLDPEDVLDSFVSVVIENEEELLDRMKTWLARIRDDKSRMQGYGTHKGYIETLNKMQKRVLELKKETVRNE